MLVLLSGSVCSQIGREDGIEEAVGHFGGGRLGALNPKVPQERSLQKMVERGAAEASP